MCLLRTRVRNQARDSCAGAKGARAGGPARARDTRGKGTLRRQAGGGTERNEEGSRGETHAEDAKSGKPDGRTFGAKGLIKRLFFLVQS